MNACKKKIILTDKERQRILNLRKLRTENGISIIDWWKFWIENGIEEFKKLNFDLEFPWANCTEEELKKIGAVERVLMTSGDIENNPKGLSCPYCDSKYVRIIEYGYLTPVPSNYVKPEKSSMPLSINNGCIVKPENRQCLSCGEVYVEDSE